MFFSIRIVEYAGLPTTKKKKTICLTKKFVSSESLNCTQYKLVCQIDRSVNRSHVLCGEHGFSKFGRLSVYFIDCHCKCESHWKSFEFDYLSEIIGTRGNSTSWLNVPFKIVASLIRFIIFLLKAWYHCKVTANWYFGEE